MNIQRFTQKSMEALQDSKELALEYGNPSIEEAHLLYSLIKEEENLIYQLLIKMNVDVASMKNDIMEHIKTTAILIECGFLSNQQEEAKLRNKEYQQQLCCVIVSTVGRYLANT